MTGADLDRLRVDVATAGRVVAPAWPLSSLIAVNPLGGLEDRPFAEGLARAGTLFGARGCLTLPELRAHLVEGRITSNALLASLHRVLGSTTAADHGSEPAVGLLADLLEGGDDPIVRSALTAAEQVDRELGTTWQADIDLVASEHCLRQASVARSLAAPPDADPASVLLHAMSKLGVHPLDRIDFLEAHVTALPGWSAHLRWRDEHLGEEALLTYLAVRVEAEARVLDGHQWTPPTATPEPAADAAIGRLDEHQRHLVWQDAYERSAHDPLLAAIDAEPGSPVTDAVAAQVVCCIDVRSEGLRRHLEATGPYETYGYAGFFGLPVHIEPLSGGTGTDQCPVLLDPSFTVAEVADPGHDHLARQVVERGRRVAARDAAWRAAKYHPIAPLALAEAAGWPAGALAAARTGAPGVTTWLGDRLAGAAAPTHHDRRAIPLDQQATYVAAIWRLGVGKRPARLVVLCGHSSRSDNNPMESALACGACGGHPGGANARIAAAMANDPEVRALLIEQDVAIPATTWFVAAEHDTGSDVVVLLDLDKVPASHREAIDQLHNDLGRAGNRSAAERAIELPGGPTPARPGRVVRAVRRRGRDWAEPVPELGLAGNMAFVIGPRGLTRHLDLGRRVFLHSYDAEADHDGSTLTGILTAPLIVAQWINAQYHFSTTDPEVFGSGSKALHNPVGDVGVLSGPGGDLRRGLALQSVRAGGRLLHEPVRLLAVVQGRLDHVDTAISGSDTLRQIVENGWIHLVARPAPGTAWRQRIESGWVDRPLELPDPDNLAGGTWPLAG